MHIKIPTLCTPGGKSQAQFALPPIQAEQERPSLRHCAGGSWRTYIGNRRVSSDLEPLGGRKGSIRKTQIPSKRGKLQEAKMQVKIIKQNICNVALKLGWAGSFHLNIIYGILLWLTCFLLKQMLQEQNCKGKPAFKTKFPNTMLGCLIEGINTSVESRVWF